MIEKKCFTCNNRASITNCYEENSEFLCKNWEQHRLINLGIKESANICDQMKIPVYECFYAEDSSFNSACDNIKEEIEKLSKA